MLLRFILFMLFFGAIGSYCSGQNVKTDASGNYYQIADTLKLVTGRQTGKYFTDSRGNKSEVLETEKGKLFVIRRNKENKPYRYYLKLEGTKDEN